MHCKCWHISCRLCEIIFSLNNSCHTDPQGNSDRNIWGITSEQNVKCPLLFHVRSLLDCTSTAMCGLVQN